MVEIINLAVPYLLCPPLDHWDPLYNVSKHKTRVFDLQVEALVPRGACHSTKGRVFVPKAQYEILELCSQTEVSVEWDIYQEGLVAWVKGIHLMSHRFASSDLLWLWDCLLLQKDNYHRLT